MIRRRLDGLLLLDKSRGLTSNAALQQAKRLYRAEKAGHAGTLDPLASGLLPVLFGEATKFSACLLESEKAYEAEVRLGIGTATGDADGEVLERREVAVDAPQLERALAQFRGVIDQVPPMYSALKHHGRPLYELARKGGEVERAPRRIMISVLELLARDGDRLRLAIRCSKGTYVRSLAIDLGVRLGTVAHVSALRRTAAGGFGVADAMTLDELGVLDEAARDQCLRPLAALVGHLPRVVLDASAARRFAHGQTVAAGGAAAGRCQVWGAGSALLGLGEVGQGGELQPLRLLASAAQATAPSAENRKNLVD